jgi:hypothetical protein
MSHFVVSFMKDVLGITVGRPRFARGSWRSTLRLRATPTRSPSRGSARPKGFANGRCMPTASRSSLLTFRCRLGSVRHGAARLTGLRSPLGGSMFSSPQLVARRREDDRRRSASSRTCGRAGRAAHCSSPLARVPNRRRLPPARRSGNRHPERRRVAGAGSSRRDTCLVTSSRLLPPSLPRTPPRAQCAPA